MRKFGESYDTDIDKKEQDENLEPIIVTCDELKELILLSVDDEDSKSICICGKNCDADAIAAIIDEYIDEHGKNAESKFMDIDGKHLTDNFEDAILDEPEVPEILFIRGAEDADVEALRRASLEFKVIAVCDCGEGDECPLFDELKSEYECVVCDDDCDTAAADADTDDKHTDDTLETPIGEEFESVADKFSKYSHLYESLEENKDDDGDDNDDDSADDKKDDDDDVEDVDVKAIAITVNKDDVEKCKTALIDAGVAEDDIDVIDDDTDDKDTVDIKVDVNSIIEAKNFIEEKTGKSFKDFTGIEIVEPEDAEKADDESGKDDDTEKKDDEKDTNSGDDITADDFDFGDIFGVDDTK